MEISCKVVGYNVQMRQIIEGSSMRWTAVSNIIREMPLLDLFSCFWEAYRLSNLYAWHDKCQGKSWSIGVNVVNTIVYSKLYWRTSIFIRYPNIRCKIFLNQAMLDQILGSARAGGVQTHEGHRNDVLLPPPPLSLPTTQNSFIE